MWAFYQSQASRDSGKRFLPSGLRMIIKFQFFTLVFKWVELEEGFSRLVHKENMQSKFFWVSNVILISWIRIQGGKSDPQKVKKFHALKCCWGLKACLDVLCGGLGIIEFQFLIKKHEDNFSFKFCLFLIIKTLVWIRIHIRIRIVLKCWILIRSETHADPKNRSILFSLA